MERGPNVNNKVLNATMVEVLITFLKLIIDHMHSLTLATVITDHKEFVEVDETF